MGELSDQIMSGGPDLLPLSDEQSRLRDAVAADPGAWSWALEHILDPLAESIRQDMAALDERTLYRAGAVLLPWGDLTRYRQAIPDPDSFARKILVWLGHGPALWLGGPTWCPAFCRAVAERAAWQRGLVDKDWWIGGPYQIMDALRAI